MNVKVNVKVKVKVRVMTIAVSIGLIVIAAASGGMVHAREMQDKKALLETGSHRGTVLSTMNSGGYTYIEFDENGEKRWAACRQTDISVGDTIEFAKAAPMKNFYSRTLDKTFETILFVGRVTVAGAKSVKGSEIPQLPEGHVPVGPQQPAQPIVEPGTVQKAGNGFTVEECYTKKNALAGKVVTVRGRVVKISSKILGRNWVHIRDGSGKSGFDDLTVTTAETVMMGDMVLVTGKIAYNKNLGSGYAFPAIIEDAKVTVEETAGPVKKEK